MNVNNRINMYFVTFLIVFFLIGCVGTPSVEKEQRLAFNGSTINNRLTLEGKSITLPEDWSFVHNIDKEGTLFNFRSPEGIEGGLEYISFDYEIDIEELNDFYKDFVFQSDERIHVSKIEHDKLGSVTSFTGIANNRNIYTLLLSEGSNVTFIYFSSSEDFPITTQEISIILDTYSIEDRSWMSVREKPGMPLFSSVDNTWIWYNDFKDGFYIAKDIEDAYGDIIAGIWSLTTLELDELKNRDEFNIQPFTYNFTIQNKDILCTVYGQKSSSDDSSLYIIFELNGTTYCLNLMQNVIEADINPSTLLVKLNIQELFDYYLLFSEGI
ncbi:MAG: hypothetical protein OCD02_09185 [Spirochaetaceae bacterium]